MSKPAQAFIGLGSNLDKPAEQITQALDAMAKLAHCTQLECAHWYSSKAIGPGDQPDYINTVASLNTTLTPRELLGALQGIENQQGRQRDIRWGARTLDLDLLLYNDIQLHSEELTLPHPALKQRNFVLVPLYDLAPALVLPDGSPLADLVQQCGREQLSLIDRYNSL